LRCFVAVDVPEQVLRQLGRLQEQLRREVEGVRWVKPSRMHLTLVFLGETTDDFVRRAEPELAVACASSGPFRAALQGLGAFPDSERARVVWVGMREGREELLGLQASVAAALARVGFQPERRKFSPHLTLGRLRSPGAVSALCERKFASDTFDVDQVVLYRSVLRPSGPEYTRLVEFPLGQAPA